MRRPVPARWFEVLVTQRDAPVMLVTLASTGAIELEMHRPETAQVSFSDLRAPLARYADLARRFAPYWPTPHRDVPVSHEAGRRERPTAVRSGSTPRDTLLRALGRLSMWHAMAVEMVGSLQAGEQELAELVEWRALLSSPAAAGLPLESLAATGPLVARCLYLFAQSPALTHSEQTLVVQLPFEQQIAVLAIMPHAQRDAFHRQAIALKGRSIAIPHWFHGSVSNNLHLLERHALRLQRRNERLRALLSRLAMNYELPTALADIEQVRWFAELVEKLPGSHNFAWITGWSAARPGQLEAALEHGRHPALVQYPPPPAGASAPLVLSNPCWIRPFELFVRSLGMPARSEVDPSMLLALIVPLMFGYMFADVGQGAVLVVAGLWLGRRQPVLRLLVAGGLAAMVFGFLFGSVFSRSDLLPALWLHPPTASLTVLGIPLLFGAGLLVVGQLLNGMQAWWRGAVREWWWAEAGLLLAYLAGGLALVQPAVWPLAVFGLVWAVIGQARQGHSISGWLTALGSVLEHVFQLAINTLSFTRVGAFALAHAGLSSAIVVLAAATGHPLLALAVMLVGNVLVLVLETLVVSIQTTRLVLFEFFIRFLKADGRAFRPLPTPQVLSMRRLA